MRRQRLRNPAPWICPLPERYLLAFEVGLTHEEACACYHAALASRACAPPPPPPPPVPLRRSSSSAAASLPAPPQPVLLRLEEFGEALVRLADAAWSTVPSLPLSQKLLALLTRLGTSSAEAEAVASRTLTSHLLAYVPPRYAPPPPLPPPGVAVAEISEEEEAWGRVWRAVELRDLPGHAQWAAVVHDALGRDLATLCQVLAQFGDSRGGADVAHAATLSCLPRESMTAVERALLERAPDRQPGVAMGVMGWRKLMEGAAAAGSRQGVRTFAPGVELCDEDGVGREVGELHATCALLLAVAAREAARGGAAPKAAGRGAASGGAIHATAAAAAAAAAAPKPASAAKPASASAAKPASAGATRWKVAATHMHIGLGAAGGGGGAAGTDGEGGVRVQLSGFVELLCRMAHASAVRSMRGGLETSREEATQRWLELGLALPQSAEGEGGRRWAGSEEPKLDASRSETPPPPPPPLYSNAGGSAAHPSVDSAQLARRLQAIVARCVCAAEAASEEEKAAAAAEGAGAHAPPLALTSTAPAAPAASLQALLGSTPAAALPGCGGGARIEAWRRRLSCDPNVAAVVRARAPQLQQLYAGTYTPPSRAVTKDKAAKDRPAKQPGGSSQPGAPAAAKRAPLWRFDDLLERLRSARLLRRSHVLLVSNVVGDSRQAVELSLPRRRVVEAWLATRCHALPPGPRPPPPPPAASRAGEGGVKGGAAKGGAPLPRGGEDDGSRLLPGEDGGGLSLEEFVEVLARCADARYSGATYGPPPEARLAPSLASRLAVFLDHLLGRDDEAASLAASHPGRFCPRWPTSAVQPLPAGAETEAEEARWREMWPSLELGGIHLWPTWEPQLEPLLHAHCLALAAIFTHYTCRAAAAAARAETPAPLCWMEAGSWAQLCDECFAPDVATRCSLLAAFRRQLSLQPAADGLQPAAGSLPLGGFLALLVRATTTSAAAPSAP